MRSLLGLLGLRRSVHTVQTFPVARLHTPRQQNSKSPHEEPNLADTHTPCCARFVWNEGASGQVVRSGRCARSSRCCALEAGVALSRHGEACHDVELSLSQPPKTDPRVCLRWVHPWLEWLGGGVNGQRRRAVLPSSSRCTEQLCVGDVLRFRRAQHGRWRNSTLNVDSTKKRICNLH